MHATNLSRAIRECHRGLCLLLVVVSSSATTMACSGGRIVSPTDVRETRAVVFGSVTDSHGAAVANAIIAIRSYLQGCPVNASGAGNVTASTDVNGHYRAQITTGAGPAVQCIAATATQSGTAGITVAGAMVQFKDMDAPPCDSVQVDIRLP